MWFSSKHVGFYLSDSRWVWRYDNGGRGRSDSVPGCQSWRAGELTLALSCKTGQQVTWLQTEAGTQTLEESPTDPFVAAVARIPKSPDLQCTQTS